MTEFNYDVFLSYSAKDKAIVRALAERLRADGLRVWFDEWILKPGDSIPKKIDEGLEQSRVLVLSMSAQAYGDEWAQLEGYTFRFRDPLNSERRFVPLRLDSILLFAARRVQMGEGRHRQVLGARGDAQVVQSSTDRFGMRVKSLRFLVRTIAR